MVGSFDILNASVLIVDDQNANVRLLERILAGSGYTSVASTMDPLAVCELHRKNRYDLILLDLKMPRMDGFEVMKGLKKIETDGHLPVLVITAQSEYQQRAMQAGARDFLAKPFVRVDVLTRISNALHMLLSQKATKNSGKGPGPAEPTAGLRESEELFRQLATHCPAVLFMLNVGSETIRYVNPAGEKITGRRVAAGDRLDKILAAIHPEDLQRVRREAEKVSHGGVDLDCRIVRPDKTVRWMHVRTFPITDSKGNMYRIGGIMEDVTGAKMS